MLIDVQDLLVAGDDETEARVTRAVKTLADELNSGLFEYRVTYTHLDTGDYLEFIQNEPDKD